MVIICFVALLSTGEASQWPSLRGAQEGRASLTYPGGEEINEWHYSYKSARRYETGLAVWASPALAVVGGRPMAFIGGYDQTMHALDLVDKRAVWRKITNGEIAAAPAVGIVDGLDVVFWGSADRTVYANVALNGRQLWTRELVGPSSTLGKVHMSSPFIDGDRLYIACFVYDKALPRNEQNASLYCLDTYDGRIIWKLAITTGFVSSPVGFEIDGKLHIAIAARRGLLQCFDVSGAIPSRAWQFQMPHEVMGSPVVSTDRERPLLFLGSKFGDLIAIDARSGEEVWRRMAGNWIDNSACIGDLDGNEVVYVGSHDYNVYALDAASGELIWKRALGGEVYSAPCVFRLLDRPVVAAAALDNHVYVMDAGNGEIITSFFSGNAIWDKVAKGETLWGSPAAIEAGGETALVHGSFNDFVYVLPLAKECSLTAMSRSASSLWISLIVVFVVFTGVVLPIVLRGPARRD